jgi:hypothetical protein
MGLPDLTLLLAADQTTLQRGRALLLIIAITILFLTALAMLVLLRRGGRAGSRSERAVARQRRARVDAWSEAGRRAEPDEDEGDADDHDTVDIDPSDLSPGDIEPDGDGNRKDEQ